MKNDTAVNPGDLGNGRKATFPDLGLESNFEEERLDIVAYWRMAMRQKKGILGITFISVIIGVLSAFSFTPIYKAETALQINPLQPDIGLGGQRVDTPLISLFYETQHEIILSRTVAELVVKKLELVSWRQRSLDIASGDTSDDNKKSSDMLSEALWAIKARLNWNTWLPENWRPKPDATALHDQLIDEIKNGLKVSQAKQSEIVKVSYQSPDPKLAAAVANAVAEAYIEFGLTSRLSGVKNNASWLNTQLDELRSKVKESEAALQAYQRKLGIVDTANQQRLESERLSSLTAELIKVQTTRIEAQIRSNQARSLKGHAVADAKSLGDVLNSPSVRNLSKEENDLARKMQELSERYGDKHPKMISARSDLREARRSLQKEVDKIVDSIRKEYNFAVTQEQEIRSLIEAQKKEISDLADASFELALLEREVENNRKLYESFLDKFKEANLAEEYDASNVRVVDPATVPSKPFKPNKPRMIVITGILGLIFGILVALLRERLDNTFKTTDHIEDELGIPSLGIVPMVHRGEKTGALERQVMDNPHSSFAEHINYIRSSLLFSKIDQPPKTILITSATSDEGKTILSINLAAAFSQLDRTLLLDVDLRKSNITTLLGMEAQPGITEVITSQIRLNEAVIRLGSEEGLFVLPRGSAPHNPLQLLSSPNFHSLLDKLKKNFAHIVMDAPPVLAVSDATALGHLADSVILAIKAESTTHEMLSEAQSRLRKSGIQATGAVLCQTDTRRMADYVKYYDANYAKYYTYSSGQGTAHDYVSVSGSTANTVADRDPQLYPAQSGRGSADRDRRPFVHKVKRRGADHGGGPEPAWVQSLRRSREATNPNAKTK
jgi:capsular exopolysaccharide synthesis family protein